MPKEMLPIVDKPTIQYIVEEAVHSGIEDIIIVTGRNKRSIEDHFDINHELEWHLREKNKDSLLQIVQSISNLTDIHYVRQKQALGLGHAIGCARTFVGNEPFAVLLGDTVINSKTPCLQQLMDVYAKKQAPIVGVQKVNWSDASKYGVIAGEPESHNLYAIHDLVEKPSDPPSNLAIMGRYILEPDIFDILEHTNKGVGGEIQLTDALKHLLESKSMYGQLFEGKLYDVGDKLGFLQATIEMACDNEELSEAFDRYLMEFCKARKAQGKRNRH